MNPTQKNLAVGALLLAATPALHAQYTPPPPMQPFPGYLNQELRAKDPYWSNWDFGGQFRSRYEVRDNALVAPPFHDFKAVSAGVASLSSACSVSKGHTRAEAPERASTVAR